MKIGIIGLGCIGSANTSGFEYLGHTVVGHDITHETTIDMVLSSEITFLCLPTPSKDDGDCDTSIVEGVIGDLNLLNYTGIIVIRSTVPPGFTSSMQEKFPHRTICFSPEFLRERNAEEDFIRNATIEMNTRNETLNHLELQRKRINKRTKRNEKKLEKRIEDFESAKYDWIENRYSYVCGKKWNQMRNIVINTMISLH